MKPLLINSTPSYEDFIYVKKVQVPNLDTPLHFHNDYEMVFMVKSTGKRIVGDSIENFTDGDLVIMGPNLPHVWYNEREYYEHPDDNEVEAFVIYFRPNLLDDIVVNVHSSTSIVEFLQDVKRGIKIDATACDYIAKLIIDVYELTGLKRTIKLLQIIDSLADTKSYTCLSSLGYNHTFNQRDVERIDKVYQYVMANFNQSISLNEAAAIASMTPSSFCKYFKARTLKTFTNFVNEVRIGYARKLLFNDALSISQICFESGFNNLANFNRNFKCYTQCSPREFRESLKKGLVKPEALMNEALLV